jgi:hypothetical protein
MHSKLGYNDHYYFEFIVVYEQRIKFVHLQYLFSPELFVYFQNNREEILTIQTRTV